MKSFPRTVAIFLAVLFTVLSLLTLSVWERVFSSDLYVNSLSEAGVYKQVTTVIENKVTHAIVTSGNEYLEELRDRIAEDEDKTDQEKKIDEGIIWVVEIIIENNSEDVVAAVSESMNIESGMEDGTRAVLDGSFSWLRGERETSKAFDSIPTTEEIEKLEGTTLVEEGFTYVAANALGVADLPECSSKKAETEALEQLDESGLMDVSCTSDDVQPVIDDTISDLIPQQVVEKLETDIDDILDKYDLNPVLNTIYEGIKALSEAKQYALDARTYVQSIQYSAIVLFALSVPMALLAVVLSKGDRFMTLVRMYFASGFILVGFVAVHHFILTPIAMNQIDFSRFEISSEGLSSAQEALWMDSVENASEMIIRGQLDYTFGVGMTLILVTGGIWILINISRRLPWDTYRAWGTEQGRKIRGYFTERQDRMSDKL